MGDRRSGSCVVLGVSHSSRLHCFIKQVVVPSSTARRVILSEEETDAILKSAADCAMGECSVDDVALLISELKEQEQILEQRLENIMNIIGQLQHFNEKKERKRDEIKAFVKDMLRVFNHDTPGFAPMGFSGDIGKGSQTAYDALPPKKWTDPNKK